MTPIRVDPGDAALRRQLADTTAERDQIRHALDEHTLTRAAQAAQASRTADVMLNRIGTALRQPAGVGQPALSETVICGQAREDCLRDQETMRRLLVERGRP